MTLSAFNLQHQMCESQRRVNDNTIATFSRPVFPSAFSLSKSHPGQRGNLRQSKLDISSFRAQMNSDSWYPLAGITMWTAGNVAMFKKQLLQ
jgi:hypothetical protein